MKQDSLIKHLRENDVSEQIIEDVIDSGYFFRTWSDPSRGLYTTVSDPFYGSKQFSSSFSTVDFISHIKGERPISNNLPPFHRICAKSFADVQEILRTKHLARYAQDGSLTFRGQPREYYVRRRIPNPLRSDASGREISIMPGAYRQGTDKYSLAADVNEHRTFEFLTGIIEDHDEYSGLGDQFSYDLMRTEQHYATQTRGLDLAFDIRSALFFATNQFMRDEQGKAFYRSISKGEHQGVLYLFRFTMPSVNRTEYLIRDFDFFKKHRPERIIRQSCGLPLIGDYERNIAITDIDCIIELDKDFEYDNGLTQEFMFPSTDEDLFYKKLLDLKNDFPDDLDKIVEYQCAR
ncbi:hypothetical protein [Methylobacterium sp.]|uniref:hypothetical protein n=1 Tax=Methylobacterium sp. TaxID=409 RepID=UPI0025DA4B31|nr:hypothetical protein [Methylobacterium sp.]MBY0256968.1 hypothetical protein [Methylobacterium sp.]